MATDRCFFDYFTPAMEDRGFTVVTTSVFNEDKGTHFKGMGFLPPYLSYLAFNRVPDCEESSYFVWNPAQVEIKQLRGAIGKNSRRSLAREGWSLQSGRLVEGETVRDVIIAHRPKALTPE